MAPTRRAVRALLLPSAALAAAAALGAPRTARAQFGWIAPASEFTQLLNYGRLLAQYAQQVQQYRTQVQQFANQVQHTQRFSTLTWGQAMYDIQQVNGIVQSSQALGYTAANLDTRFSQRYQNYNGYAAQNITAQTAAQKNAQWSTEVNGTTLTALKGAQAQANQFATEDADLKKLETQGSAASGHMQALQVSNQLAAANARQAQKLRQAVLMQTQLTANAEQVRQDRAAYQQAALTRALSHTGSAATGGMRF